MVTLKCDIRPHTFFGEYLEKQGIGDTAIDEMDLHAAGMECFEV